MCFLTVIAVSHLITCQVQNKCSLSEYLLALGSQFQLYFTGDPLIFHFTAGNRTKILRDTRVPSEHDEWPQQGYYKVKTEQ